MLFNQNGWSIRVLEGGDYLISDAQGNQCITTYIRITSGGEFVIGHPVVPDIRINTRHLKSLPLSCRGDLTNPKTIRDQESYYRSPVIDWGGPMYPSARRKPDKILLEQD